MQPYFFPYIGYFQLINLAGVFVILDDVNFIKRGWINRNRILINGGESPITVPLAKPSQNRRINQTRIADDPLWKEHMLRSVSHAYARAPHYDNVFSLVESSLRSNAEYISELALSSILAVVDYLGLKTRIVRSSTVYGNGDLRGEARIIDICLKEHTTGYLNLPGGRDLYRADNFRSKGLSLGFLEPGDVSYRQLGKPFVPWLSIIDVLMFNSRKEVLKLLSCCTVRDGAGI